MFPADAMHAFPLCILNLNRKAQYHPSLPLLLTYP